MTEVGLVGEERRMVVRQYRARRGEAGHLGLQPRDRVRPWYVGKLGTHGAPGYAFNPSGVLYCSVCFGAAITIS